MAGASDRFGVRGGHPRGVAFVDALSTAIPGNSGRWIPFLSIMPTVSHTEPVEKFFSTGRDPVLVVDRGFCD